MGFDNIAQIEILYRKYINISLGVAKFTHNVLFLFVNRCYIHYESYEIENDKFLYETCEW